MLKLLRDFRLGVTVENRLSFCLLKGVPSINEELCSSIYLFPLTKRIAEKTSTF